MKSKAADPHDFLIMLDKESGKYNGCMVSRAAYEEEIAAAAGVS